LTGEVVSYKVGVHPAELIYSIYYLLNYILPQKGI